MARTKRSTFCVRVRRRNSRMTAQYQHLGVFSDWVAAAHTHNHIHPNATPGAETRHLIREVLGFSGAPAIPQDIHSERTWIRDGLAGDAGLSLHVAGREPSPVIHRSFAQASSRRASISARFSSQRSMTHSRRRTNRPYHSG